jgi:hypothetical protein
MLYVCRTQLGQQHDWAEVPAVNTVEEWQVLFHHNSGITPHRTPHLDEEGAFAFQCVDASDTSQLLTFLVKVEVPAFVVPRTAADHFFANPSGAPQRG